MFRNASVVSLSKLDYENKFNRVREFLYFFESSPLSLKLLEKFIFPSKKIVDKRLQVVVDGVIFENPLVVAAGWDKLGRNVKALYQLGFAGVEVGTVVAYPQVGNPRPWFFMIAPGVSLNSNGFNSPGMERVGKNLERYRNSGIPMGINIGKNKYVPNKAAAELYTVVVRRLYTFASYFVVNVSSPNSPHLRKLQDKELLDEIFAAVNETMDHVGKRKPLFVKIAPELAFTDIDGVIEMVRSHRLTGIIATNTSSNAHLRAKYGDVWEDRAGGLGGDDGHYREMATKQVAYIYKQTRGKVTVIGVGGIKNAETALEKIRAGASLIQVLSAIQSEGLGVAGRINQGILDYMEKTGITSLNQLVGIDAKKWV